MSTTLQRLASIESKQEDSALQQNRILTYLEKSAESREQQGRDIAVIKREILGFTEYQQKCDADRVDQGKKINSLENSRKNFYWNGSAFITVTAFITTSIIEWFKK